MRILRGQTLFNSKPIQIVGVGGLNDDLNVAVIPGTCGTCHDSPNVGNHSVSAPLNIGVGDLDSSLDVTYLPVITLQNRATHEVKRTTDPGRALITGLWKDVGRLKGPILRGLASRAAVLPQRLRRVAEGCPRFLRKTLPHRPHAARERRSHRLSQHPVARGQMPVATHDPRRRRHRRRGAATSAFGRRRFQARLAVVSDLLAL